MIAVRVSNGLRYEGVRRNGCTHVCIYEEGRSEPFYINDFKW